MRYANFSHYLMWLLMLIGAASPASGQQERITNGNFSQGTTGWQFGGNFQADDRFACDRSLGGYAYLAAADGSPGNSLLGFMYQTVSIPSTAETAQLEFYYSIGSTDTTSPGVDVLNVTVQDNAGNFLDTVVVRSNVNRTSNCLSYTRVTKNMIAFAGSTVRINFLANTNNNGLPSVFRIDDVSLAATLATPPAAPSNLDAIGNGNSVSLSWDDNASNETSFRVERKLGSGGTWSTIASNLSANTESYTNTNLPFGNRYYYRVVAVNAAGTATSSEDSATTLDQPQLSSPANGAVFTAGSTVTLDWPNVTGADSYSVSIGSTCGATEVLNNAATAASSYDVNLPPGTYTWQARAFNVTHPGVSAPSTCRTFTVAGNPCGPGLIPDCNGHCAPASWSTDGLCDNGVYSYNGTPIFFNCPQFGNDNGACASPPDPILNPPNHGQPAEPPHYEPPAQPSPTETKYVLVTHGYNTTAQRFADFWLPLKDAIDAQVGPDWKVRAYNWTEDSQTLLGPDLALVTAIAHGYRIGREIGQQHYQHVHLIAHSAGSALIAAAASRIRYWSPTTTIHTTYLDAYAGSFLLAGVGNYDEAYGGNSDWSDHYYSREYFGYNPTCDASLVPHTGEFTQLVLPRCNNLDVSNVDPSYSAGCLSTHTWPTCYYRFTVDGAPGADCAPPSPSTPPRGFAYSYERWTGGGGLQGWLSAMTSQHPQGAVECLYGNCSTGGGQLRAPPGPPVDLSSATSFASPDGGSQVSAGALTMTTNPLGAPAPTATWINFNLATTAPADFVTFNLSFGPNASPAGLVTAYIDGIKVGVVDERETLPGVQPYTLPTGGTLAPGSHILSFRLDPLNGTRTDLTVNGVATGLTRFVAQCSADFNGDDDFGTDQDIEAFFRCLSGVCCPTCGSADFNGDGDFGTDQDIESFFRVLSGGPC